MVEYSTPPSPTLIDAALLLSATSRLFDAVPHVGQSAMPMGSARSAGPFSGARFRGTSTPMHRHDEEEDLSDRVVKRADVPEEGRDEQYACVRMA